MEHRATLTDFTYKYRSDAPMLLDWSRGNLELTAMRNETVACQVVLQSGVAALATLGDAPLFNWAPAPRLRLKLGRWRGSSEASPQTEAFFVGLVAADDGHVLVGDPLLHDDRVELAGGQPQALWISMRFPAETTPGVYRLPITLYQAEDLADEQVICSLEVAVNVRGADIAGATSLHTSSRPLAASLRRRARGHGVALWSEEHWRLISAYAAEMARLGQKAITLIASDAPWAGQRCRRNPEYPSALHEYNIVGVSRAAGGDLHFDFTRLDRYVETFMRLGIDRELGVLGLLAAWDDEFGRPLVDHPDNVRLACLEESTGRITWLRRQAELRQYLAALADHLKSRGWWEITRFEADEPADVSLFRARLAFLRSVCPDARIKIAANHMEMIEAFVDEVADWVPQLEGIGADVEAFRRNRDVVQGRGDRFAWYVCCNPQRPNNFITSPSIEGRFQGWYTAWAGLDGFLRWAFTCWPADPWRRPGWRWPVWSSGDMFFVYPGKDGRPVRTLRGEALLMGIQDFELIALARRQAETDPVVREALASAFKLVVRGGLADFVNVKDKTPDSLYSLDAYDYEQARQLLIAALSGDPV